tara:strand:+ start:328 stop:555 length:228 start_codon:yes stop_codon:yes gene_type:complete
MEEHNEPHDHWGRPIKLIKLGEIIMNLEKAYKEWQENNPDHRHVMQEKKQLKRRTIQLWSRKVASWNNRKKRGEI